MRLSRLLAAAGLAALLLGCAGSSVDRQITAAEAQRLPDGAIEIRWSGGPADIYKLSAPGQDPRAAQPLARGDLDHVFQAAGSPKERLYFFVAAEGSRRGLYVAERLLPLEGGRNFRDLGGYRTLEGRHLRWGRLYRSGSMVRLTDSDYRYLSGLGIKAVYDFRFNSERASEPTAWRAEPAAEYVSWPGELKSEALSKAFSARPVTGKSIRAAMIRFYEELPYTNRM